MHKINVDFHNRFDIEINDEWVGFAENIVLDQMYSRLCNFQTYFNNIHFGTGAGSLSSSRTTLFSHLNTKTAELVEVIESYPTSKVTKKIILQPSEFIDSIITEVGLAFGATNTNLITHAMLKDAEGNPLSLEKGALDVVTIYATVFITLNQSGNTWLAKSGRLPNDYNTLQQSINPYPNQLVRYLTKHTTPQFKVTADQGVVFEHGNANSNIVFTKSITPVANVSAKKVTFTSRFEVTEAAGEISAVGLLGILRYNLEPHTFTNHLIGVGDGIKTTFDIPSRLSNLEIKIDDVIADNFTITNGNNPNNGILSLGELSSEILYETMLITNPQLAAETTNMYVNSTAEGIELGTGKFKESMNGKSLTIYGRGNNTSTKTNYRFESSANGIDWTVRRSESVDSNATQPRPPLSITWDDLYYRLIAYGTATNIQGLVNPKWYLLVDKPKIIFSTPPQSGKAITLNGLAPYKPKNIDYILDVFIEIQFGEGT